MAKLIVLQVRACGWRGAGVEEGAVGVVDDIVSVCTLGSR